MEGDFRIDQWLIQPKLNAIVSPDNKTVQLEPKVMEVLDYLAGHAGEVLPKERILQALWGDTFVTENALTRCIAELRKLFQDDAAEPRFIQTITKKGYRLITPQGHVKVMDFGLAKRLPQAHMPASLEETVSALTREGTTTGTLPHGEMT